MILKESKETFVISHLRNLGNYIEQMDLTLLKLYSLWVTPAFESRKLNEVEESEEKTLIQKFAENNNLAAKEISFIERALPNAVFTKSQKNIFEKTLVSVVGKYRSYNKDYKDLSSNVGVSENLKSAHNDFLHNMELLNKKINEYNERSEVESILSLRQANELAKEKEQNKKDENFEEVLKGIGV